MRRFSAAIVVGGLFCVWVTAQVGCNAITHASDLTAGGEPTSSGSSTTSASSSSSASSSGDGSSTSSSASSSSSSSGATSSSGTSGSTGAPDAGGGCPKPETDLVAYYPLDEINGTVVHDCSGNNHDGTVISQHNQMWTAGHFGNAFSTTANAGCIDLGEAAALKPEADNFSVAAWVRVVVFGGGGNNPHYIFGRTALPDSAGWRVGTDVGSSFGTKLYTQTSGLLLITSAGQHPTNVWTHVAATYTKNGSVDLYVNGAPAGSNALTQIVPDNTATLRIGCRGDNDDGYFDGAIDEVRLYARALTGAEITALSARTP